MPDKQIGVLKNPTSALIALKPRQVLLAQGQLPKPEPCRFSLMAGSHQLCDASLTPEQRTHLLHSVLRFLEANHFSKSLKRLIKEAQIEGYSWKDHALDLQNIYCTYLQRCLNVDVNSNDHKGQGKQKHEDSIAAQEIDGKKKKKKIIRDKDSKSENVRESKADENMTKPRESLEEKAVKMTCETEEINSVDSDVEATKSSKRPREKQKKKNKLETETNEGNGKISDVKSGLPERKPKTLLSEETVESKDKKKRNKLNIDTLSDKDTLVDPTVDTKEKKKKKNREEKEKICHEPSENGADNHKDSKKRKRPATDENEAQTVGESRVEDTKRRKTVDLEANGTHTVENGEANKTKSQKSSKNGVEKSGQTRQPNGSAEPKTVNAFQRVKIDEVEFVDERLQDNSYWAKDGADKGYGAKAQEVLGQVRGRDFRHEKTKKKRGSYRGGQIDLDSHSIKFNYSDDE